MIKNTGKLAGNTLFITGASRGIGKAIALKAARDGANIVVAAKTAEPHPKLPGTIYTAAKEIEEAGGKALPCIVDVRDESSVTNAVKQAVERFGGIDIVVNNASAISLTGTLETDMKRYDLMQNINARGTFLVSKVCLPYLKNSKNPHILNLSPPINLAPKWFANHCAYTIAKYGMSLCVLGMAEEFKNDKICVNALWPKTAILTAAMDMLAGSEAANCSRKPEIVSDAAYVILTSKDTGKFFIDEDVIKASGVQNLDEYACNPAFKDSLMLDFFLDDEGAEKTQQKIVGNKSSDSSVGDNDEVTKLFSKISGLLSKDLAEKTKALYEFSLTDGGRWYIDLRPESPSCGKGAAPDKPDAVLTMKTNDFQNLFAGKLKAASAYMTGKLKISGNLNKAMKLEKLMGGLKSKL